MHVDTVLFVVGTRPNFVKIAPLCRAMSAFPELSYKILHTGQHYDTSMSAIFFEELEIPQPDYCLNVGSDTHGRQMANIMIKLEALCLKHFFAGLVVIGDVNSTLAGALIGTKLQIPVFHIEAGLRSFNRSMPEEINRLATDHISDVLFAPTQTALANLRAEGLEGRAYFSGDVMYDTLLYRLAEAEKRSVVLNELQLTPGEYYLATLHRPYNVDDPHQLREIIVGLQQADKPVVLPAHPRLKKNLTEFAITPGRNILLCKPLGYLDFIMLEKFADKIVTDSGGIQKEAFFLQTPCITLRTETEWVETVEASANVLIARRSATNITQALAQPFYPRYHEKPYGTGNASEKILRTLQHKLEALINTKTF